MTKKKRDELKQAREWAIKREILNSIPGWAEFVKEGEEEDAAREKHKMQKILLRMGRTGEDRPDPMAPDDPAFRKSHCGYSEAELGEALTTWTTPPADESKHQDN